MRGYTQVDLAKRAGVRQGTISQVETGLEAVKLTTVMDLLRALDLEIVLFRRNRSLVRGDLDVLLSLVRWHLATKQLGFICACQGEHGTQDNESEATHAWSLTRNASVCC